jgi:cobalt-precorrin-5B (C1)-methyltransferase
MSQGKLRRGYSTGSCAAAAAKAATASLFGHAPERITLLLPWGSVAAAEVLIAVVGSKGGDGWASCGVIKDGGDDPDATHGMEIRALVTRLDEVPGACHIDHTGPTEPTANRATGINDPVVVEITGGEGVGRVTKPGLAPSVGAAAINPVPLSMIEASVRAALGEAGFTGPGAFRVVISAPEGAERAKRTMNARLGILGGISILGTTGVVIPMSTAAWTATIDACLDMAKISGATRALLAFGRTSERSGQELFKDLADNAAVLMGDHVGYALDATAERGLGAVIVGQFAKFCKLAGGHFATHVRDSRLDLNVVRKLMLQAGFATKECDSALDANTAREIYQRVKDDDRGLFQLLAHTVAERGAERMRGKVKPGTEVQAVLFGYAGECLARVVVHVGEGDKK